MIGGYAPWFHEELLRRVTEDRITRMSQIGEGFCQDFTDYRYDCGFIAGLSHALVIADEIKKELDAA